jgi:hypothetical protein
MSVEKFRPMSEEEAHEEANMLRARLGVSPESGKVEGPDQREDRQPTAEDYDKALAAVEELKRVAEEEPNALKILNRMTNAMEALIRIPGFGVAFLARLSHALAGSEPGGPKERWKRSAALTDALAEFDDAESQLRRLKAKGERFGRKEVQNSAE